MSRTDIKTKVKVMLAGRAAGRCQFRGCNEVLDEEQLTRRRDNFSAFAHIIADSPKGPRGEEVRSPLLATSIDNLMMLCHVHHKLIDGDNWRDFSEKTLLQMKAEHEERVRALTDLKGQHRTHLLMMEANIGTRPPLVRREGARAAALPRWAQDETWVALSRSRLKDGTDRYWASGIDEVDYAVKEVDELLRRRVIEHVSVFALAPIPLLMWLGYRLGDIVPGEAFQRRRDIQGWSWSRDFTDLGFQLVSDVIEEEPGPAVLAMSISDRVTVPEPCVGMRTVSLEVGEPLWDCVKSREHVEEFKHHLRRAMQLLDRSSMINVVSALPNSLAVEFGRTLLPKVHPPLCLWEHNEAQGGWSPAVVMHGGEARVA